MTEWAATDDRICGFGERGSVRLDVEGWQPGGRPPSLSAEVSAVAAGTTTGLRLPDGATVADDRRLEAGSLSPGVHRIHVPGALDTYLAFEGPATVDGSRSPRIEFPEPTPVAVGFHERPGQRPEITVPATPAGLATAVSAASRTHRTDGPERSHPGNRPATPRVSFGATSVPDALEDDGSGPTFTVPESTLAVLVAAPLAYYLGATVRVDDGPPRLRGTGREQTFEPLPSLAGAVAEALRQLCYLDSRTRTLDCETDLRTGDDVVPGDGRLDDGVPVERLAAARELPVEALPTWPLATYVTDDVENGRYLPYVLDRLGLVYPANASALDPQALLQRSLDEFFRGETPNVEAVDPALGDSRFHAWLGDGTPVDAYSLVGSPVARREFDGAIRVDVVCNDREMWAEGDVVDVYRNRIDDQEVDVHVHHRLSRRELADVFERRSDLVHFVGHCEVEGMVCPDGTLAAAELDSCGADAFFLNACGSYYEGYDLVRRGASVGAVTLSAVLDEQAVTVGTTFARLLTSGFSFDRALSLARGEIIVGRDYAVVGDGTTRLRPPRGRPSVVSVERTDGAFHVEYEVTPPDGVGRRYVDPFDGDEHLCGETAAATLSRTGLADLLEQISRPVVYEGTLHWSDELASNI